MCAVIQKSEISIGNARIEIVMQGGFSEHGSRRRVDMHHHPNFEIHYIEEGSFCFEQESGSVTVEKDSLVLIPPRHYHAFIGESENLKRISFELKLSILKNGSDVFSSYDKLFSTISSPMLIHRFIPELIQLGDCMGVISGEEEICKLNARFTLAFLKICEILRQNISVKAELSPDRTVQISPSDEDLTLMRILDYIRSACRRPLTLSEVARYVSLSERQVQRILSARMGESFHVILSDNRINLAKSMITSQAYSDRSLEKIAYECGYSNYVSFWSQFKKSVGKTPEQYKKAMKKSQV
ncbi:MAG: helix-turn-helix transcriptional regulator [Clostridia bacterium]|nr:helix-turn-helix transcriptional regulator [Clostridia bacterium]